ncbi:glycosyltransferase [Halomonas sp. 707D7]|uniref:glycosyltransferase n=1 Tax=Halomonas sp. 707D7 TaxID=1681044 RepID=UPI00209C7363|nr:glycosyltransferase [Halomonas sp. 707D7]MCP1314843.1 glycosyltransferase [Halomonas sp. 707D7]
MSHFAVVAPALYSHAKALEALAVCLVARGHRVTFVHQVDANALVQEPSIGFFAVGHATHPPGRQARTLSRLASPSGLGLFAMIRDLAETTDMLAHELPAAFETLGIDGVIADQMEPAGALVAEGLNLPFVSVACALPVNREQGLPLPVMPFRFAASERAQGMYATSERIYDRLMGRHARVVEHHARAFGLSPRRGLHECLSPLAQISQTPLAFDFPREALPDTFHAVGPLRLPKAGSSHRRLAELPLPQRFVFASLGTLQGHRFALFKKIAQACKRQNKALLIAHCGKLDEMQEAALVRAGATAAVDFVDQREALARAEAVITHGGLNTVVDAIDTATPMLVVPLAFDQPGVAARVLHHGLGERAFAFSRPATLARKLARLEAPDHGERLTALQAPLRAAGGAKRAAVIVEQALTTHRPVVTESAHETP